MSELERADIVWMVGAAEEDDWQRYKGKYYFNQFPFESCVVSKHSLAHMVQ